MEDSSINIKWLLFELLTFEKKFELFDSNETIYWLSNKGFLSRSEL